jgi:apolipoprotein N-acyltransferase
MRARLLAMALLLSGGALYAASFPPHDWSRCAWIALVPLLWVAARARPGTAFAAGALYGAAFFAGTVPWVIAAVGAYFGGSLLSTLLFSAAICAVFVSGYVGLFACGARRLLAGEPWVAAVAVPALWVAGELARATLFSGLPWELLGHSQWRWIDLIQIADWGGVYALSYLVAAVNVAIYFVLDALAASVPWRLVVRATLPLAVTLALVTATLGYGRSRVESEDARPALPLATIALVQGNQTRTQTPSRVALDRAVLTYSALSRRVIAETHPDLVVWPEYAVADYPEGLPLVLPSLAALAGETSAGLVFGGPRIERVDGTDRAYNAAHYLTSAGAHLAYDKVRLVPFAEYRPAPFGTAFVAGAEASFGAGTGATVFPSAVGGLGMLICYEVIFPDLVRARVRAGAELLLNIANDGWLDTSGLGAGVQHLSIAVFRAVETRRYLARAATSGISGFVDPVGRPFALTASGTRTTTIGRVEARHELTTYVRYGDVFALACVALGIGALLVRPRRARW